MIQIERMFATAVVMMMGMLMTAECCGYFRVDITAVQWDAGVVGSPVHTNTRYSLSACLLSCKDYGLCQWINYEPTTFACRLYDSNPGASSGTGLDLVPLTAVQAGSKLSECDGQACTATQHCADDHDLQRCNVLPWAGIYDPLV